MSALIRLFKTFDPINDLTQHYIRCDEYTIEPLVINEDISRYDHRGAVAVSYMKHSNFKRDLLTDRTWDHVVNAIITYLLSSPLSSLLWIKHNYPEYGALVVAVHDEKTAQTRLLFTLDSPTYEWIYTRAPFKILSRYFDRNTRDEPERKAFHIMDYLELSFIEELKSFHAKLLNNDVDEALVRMLESHKDLPHDLSHIIGDYSDICGRSNIRYFTGQACCGKTTLVSKLNFLAKSRGTIGGFTDKADNIATASCLHFSIDFVLRQYKNVIGVS